MTLRRSKKHAAQPALAACAALAALTALGVFIFAFARGGFGMAAAAALTLGGANLTAQALKDLLERPNLIGSATYASGNSFPSGTVTLVASLGFCLILVAQRRLRALAAIGAILLMSAVGASTITAGWHRLADVVGGDLISLAWAALATAALIRVQGWMPRQTWTRGLGRRTAFIAAAAGAVAIGAGAIGLAVAMVEPAPLAALVAYRATTPEAFVAAIAITIGTALVATAGYMWAMRGVALELPG